MNYTPIIVTAIWKRPEITQQFFTRGDMCQYPIFAAVSDEEDRQRAEYFGAYCVPSPNFPLSNKWQTALRFAKNYCETYGINFTHVMIMGSDNIMWGFDQYEFVHPLEGCGYCYVVKYDTKEVKYWPGYHPAHPINAGEAAGAGRLIRRDVLDALNWELFPYGMNYGLDCPSWRRMKRVIQKNNLGEIRVISNPGPVLVDIKNEDNVTGWEMFDPIDTTNEIDDYVQKL